MVLQPSPLQSTPAVEAYPVSTITAPSVLSFTHPMFGRSQCTRHSCLVASYDIGLPRTRATSKIYGSIDSTTISQIRPPFAVQYSLHFGSSNPFAGLLIICRSELPAAK
ncbi:hypothetical protein V6N13_092332 [Hibiscus sabdariffa]|uniref:Uncharacterized protein n=1 Tax=Hibiscus sabdariffa TaxID=183260 RepID=A0ABR2CC20_9ROSI